MEDITLCSREHREVFRRVWDRVMAGHPETGCPIEVTGDLDCCTLERLAACPPSADPDRRGSDWPHRGTESAPDSEDTALLRRQVQEMLESRQCYRHLGRRCRGSTAQTLTSLASDCHQWARKLAAAYFLLTGVRYWPADTLPAPPIPSLWGTLRQQHQSEQQREQLFRMAWRETEDSALQELYREMAEGCRSHCRRLSSLLEQSCP